ncbi:MAG: hypothetical protein KAJ58_01905 [Candidatus Pacebacteria bacterium]|nr:hypothetical protein [Candidatus Paceibacterota bacterium]
MEGLKLGTFMEVSTIFFFGCYIKVYLFHDLEETRKKQRENFWWFFSLSLCVGIGFTFFEWFSC